MNLSEKPEMVIRPEFHYVFIEMIGPFMETAPQAWDAMQKLVPAISAHNTIQGFLSLYNVEAELYRAGVSLAATPQKLPEGMKYARMSGGSYARFVLKGPYADLPEASGRVFEIVEKENIKMRDDFCIESYLNDPGSTAAEDLVTEILIPVR